jgi:ribosomal protein S18 acetylase RimI-like enzyme
MTKTFKGTIRKALYPDVDLLIELGKRCFYEAFNEVTAPHDMAAYLNATFQTSNIERQLKDDQSLIFIAEIDMNPAGYVYSHPAVVPECVEDKTAVKLERIYLRKRYYGLAVGDALLHTALEEARCRGYRSVWLSSWEDNDRANAFYKNWKFKAVGNQKFTVGSDIQNDFILSREI